MIKKYYSKYIIEVLENEIKNIKKEINKNKLLLISNKRRKKELNKLYILLNNYYKEYYYLNEKHL